MADIPEKVSLLRNVQSLDVSPRFQGYTKVIINIDEDTSVSAGEDSGMVLEIDNPIGTQKMAEDILRKLQGRRYQPYVAASAMLEPAAEIGDGVSIKDVYGGLYKRKRTFNRLMEADIEAPHDEEIDHEFKYESPSERKYRRDMGNVKATLIMQSNEIAARVEKTGGDNSSFGWSLLSDKFSLYSGNKEVFKCTSEGVEIDGKITAREGYIGNGSSGFTITANAIYNNISTFGGSQDRGIYLGTNGIQLGANFKVDPAGNLTAKTGTFGGQTYAGNITAGGGGGGTMSGGLLSGGSVTPKKLDTDGQKGIKGGSNFADMTAQKFTASHVLCSYLHVNGFQYERKSRTVMSSAGWPITITYLGD